MKFSVLIPVYNVEMYLTQCLESVMAQTFKDFEVIIVDDGSTDESGRICDEWVQSHGDKIKVIHKENKGLISARRVGIENARGEFCIFVDSDDFVERNLLESINEALSAHPHADMVLYSFRYYRDGQKAERFLPIAKDGTVWNIENKQELYEIFLRSYQLDALWTKAVRTEMLKADPIDYTQYYGVNMSEDTLQSIWPLTLSRNVVYIDRVLYNYRINRESVSRSYRYETIPSKNTNHVYSAIVHILPQWKKDDGVTKENLKNRWFDEALYTFVQYYENAKSTAERKKIVDFDWNSMIPEMPEKISHKLYGNIYAWIKKKDYFRIRLYFVRKSLMKRLKSMKKRVLG